MSATVSKEQRRNLKKILGEEAAAAVAECRELVQQVHNAQRVLAAQLLDNEKQLAHVREGRALDKKQTLGIGARLDEAVERLDALTLRLDKLEHSVQFVNMTLNEQRLDVVRLLQWAEARAQLTRWQRFWSFVTGRCAGPLRESPAPMAMRDAPYPPVSYESKNGGPLERVSEAVADAKPLPWRKAHVGAVEQQ